MRTRERFDHHGSGASRHGSRDAFSLIEIMIVMGLMSIMVLGLMAMFNQTQRAFRLGMTQTDVLESGRIATDMLVREIEQLTPSYGGTNAGFPPGFYAELVNVRNTGIQTLIGGTNPRRQNMMEDVFFLTRQNLNWTGTGYFVRTNTQLGAGLNTAGFGSVGTLYRFETNNNSTQFQENPSGFAVAFDRASRGADPNVSKILDGVVHFHIRAYDTNGICITPPTWNTASPYWYRGYIQANGSSVYNDVVRYAFYSNAVPAYVEVEIGILEQPTLERLRSIPVINAQSNYLFSQAGHVHLFRQRVAVRQLDRSAYQ